MKLPKQKSKIMLRSIWVILAVIVIGSSGYMLYTQSGDNPPEAIQQATHQADQTEPEAAAGSKFSDISETPTRIVIDKIGVDAPIEPVGLTDDGLMAAPDTNELVGWYKQSARAGDDKYAMLLDGHYGSDTEPAVFRNLVDLAPGDHIEVYGEQGSKLSYEVVESYQKYAEDVDMKKALYPYRQGEQSLTIITCEGQYDPVNVSYDKRTVLYAIRVA